MDQAEEARNLTNYDDTDEEGNHELYARSDNEDEYGIPNEDDGHVSDSCDSYVDDEEQIKARKRAKFYRCIDNTSTSLSKFHI